MKKTTVVLVGAPKELTEKIQEQLKLLGRDDLEVVQQSPQPDPDCTCVLCTLRREHEAKHPDRPVVVDGSLNWIDGEIRDKIRHRLWLDHLGNTVFFQSLFHPVDKLNAYTAEVEKDLPQDFAVTPLFADGDEYQWLNIDLTHSEWVDVESVSGTLTSEHGKVANVRAIAGPDFERARRNRLQRAH